MEPYTVIQLEKHRTAYSHFAILYNALNDFSYKCFLVKHGEIVEESEHGRGKDS